MAFALAAMIGIVSFHNSKKRSKHTSFAEFDRPQRGENDRRNKDDERHSVAESVDDCRFKA